LHQLKIFVYGTLKRSFEPHEELCKGPISAVPAVVRGDLFERPEGFPVLVVPKLRILANGTGDPFKDIKRQNEMGGESDRNLKFLFEGFISGEPGTVLGEILSFDDPDKRLSVLDNYEGFHPGKASLYLRVLVWAVTEKEGTFPVWTYVTSRSRRSWTKLNGGVWPAE